MDVIVPQADPATAAVGSSASSQEHQCLTLLHGLSDDHTIWQRRTSIERYVEPLGLAVIMPAVHRSFYTDMAHGLRYWTFISEEVPAVARDLFRLSSRREDNFVAGLSMGGYGAFKLALRQPDRFAAAASLSGALDMAALVSNPGDRDLDFQHVFGDRKVEGSEDDLFACAEKLLQQDLRPALYQWCGTEDFLYESNVRFRDHAQATGLSLTYEESAGGHEWRFWDRQIQRVLEWLPLRRCRQS